MPPRPAQLAITAANKKRFLQAYPDYGQITETARNITLSANTIHNWMRDDADFKELFVTLKKEIDQQEAEMYARTIREIVLDKTTPPQTRLLGSFFMLKGLEPERWRERPPTAVQVGDIRVIMAYPDYEDDAVSPRLRNQNLGALPAEDVQLLGEGNGSP